MLLLGLSLFSISRKEYTNLERKWNNGIGLDCCSKFAQAVEGEREMELGFTGKREREAASVRKERVSVGRERVGVLIEVKGVIRFN